jgi:hypothetical protein
LTGTSDGARREAGLDPGPLGDGSAEVELHFRPAADIIGRGANRGVASSQQFLIVVETNLEVKRERSATDVEKFEDGGSSCLESARLSPHLDSKWRHSPLVEWKWAH